mmetsp:Transcript_18357/g.51449  ORF Transcript_18357/g.51449 Transcript_18357/m.51449 type:complete len:237 (+) Transcript_18357:202-912(+)
MLTPPALPPPFGSLASCIWARNSSSSRAAAWPGGLALAASLVGGFGPVSVCPFMLTGFGPSGGSRSSPTVRCRASRRSARVPFLLKNDGFEKPLAGRGLLIQLDGEASDSGSGPGGEEGEGALWQMPPSAFFGFLTGSLLWRTSKTDLWSRFPTIAPVMGLPHASASPNRENVLANGRPERTMRAWLAPLDPAGDEGNDAQRAGPRMTKMLIDGNTKSRAWLGWPAVLRREGRKAA